MSVAVDTALRDFVRYTGDGLPNAPVGAPLPIGDPSSGVYNPSKAELRSAIGGIVDLAEAAAVQAALYGGIEVDTFAALVALTSGAVPIGSFVRIRSTGAVYKRAATAAADSHLTHTASTLKWYVQKAGGRYQAVAFGAVGEGLTDDRASIQACINACHAEYPTVGMILSEHLISASLVINRTVDGALFADDFRIIGGSITVSSAINLFTSSTAFTTDPVSQNVFFDGVTFYSTNPALGAYVLHGARFLRVNFTGCTFDGIKCLADGTVYTQSIYFNACNIRNWQGFFYNGIAGAYDIKVNAGCKIEHGAEGFNLSDASGAKAVIYCSFIGSLMEGLTGTPIRSNGAWGLTIAGMAFEGNTGADVLLSGGTRNDGVSITGCAFVQSATNRAAGSYASVVWGSGDRGAAVGNKSNGRLHSIPATARVAIMADTSPVEVVHNASANKTGFMSEKVSFGTLNPQTNAAAYGSPAWLVGSVVLNQAATGGVGWRCTVAGSPGTWVPIGSAVQEDANFIYSRRDSDGQIQAQISAATPTSGQTTLYLLRHNGTSATMQQVTLGATDSGGVGFKALRVPN